MRSLAVSFSIALLFLAAAGRPLHAQESPFLPERMCRALTSESGTR